MLTADITGNGFVEIIAGNLQGRGHSNTVHAQNSHVGGTAAHVNNEMAVGAADIQTRAQTGSQRLFDQEHTAGTGFDGGVDDAALFNFGNTGGNRDDHTGLGSEQTCLGGGLEHFLQHTDGHFMVRHDAILQRMHSNDVTGGTAQHIAGCSTDLQDLAGILVHCHNRGFPDNQALAVGIDQNIGCTQVNTQVIGKHRKHRHI